MGKKDKLLKTLDSSTLLELAESTLESPIEGKATRPRLLKMVKESLGIDEIKDRLKQIREIHSRHQAKLKTPPQSRKLKSPDTLARFVVKKAVFYLIAAFVAGNIVFLVSRFAKLEPDMIILSQPPEVNRTNMIRAVNEYFGFDRSFLEQYILFWRQLLTGDLGPSLTYYPASVATVISSYLPYTLALFIPVLIVSFFSGSWIGVKAAYLEGKWNKSIYSILTILSRLPTFWLNMVLVPFLAGLYFDISYSRLLNSWILAFLSLSVVNLGGWATGMRRMVTREMGSGYLQRGEKLGFGKLRLVSEAEADSAIPQFTSLNLLFVAIIGETTIIEIVSGWPGLGFLLFIAFNNLDYAVVFGCLLVIMVIVVLGNLLIDVIYGSIDPRART